MGRIIYPIYEMENKQKSCLKPPSNSLILLDLLVIKCYKSHDISPSSIFVWLGNLLKAPWQFRLRSPQVNG